MDTSDIKNNLDKITRCGCKEGNLRTLRDRLKDGRVKEYQQVEILYNFDYDFENDSVDYFDSDYGNIIGDVFIYCSECGDELQAV